MPDFEALILAALAKKSYLPLKPKALARKLEVNAKHYLGFRLALRNLVGQGRVQMGRGQTVRAVQPHGTVTGIFRSTSGGFGFVRPHPVEGNAGPDVYIPVGKASDAATGDEVLVRILRKSSRADLGPSGEILRVLSRSTHQFVGTYFERDEQGYVRVDGTVFSHSIYVGDPGAKGARPDDKVVIEMLRFPGPEDRGEAVLTEILGPRGQPGVDTLSVIRAFGLPDAFPEEVLEEARTAAAMFDDNDLEGRDDLRDELTITIDPADARDFDDAVSLTFDSKSKHWLLGVHIADVGHFAPPGGALDREARKRGTSVYLPQRVLPMFPEVISNSLASLQQDKTRFVKTAFIELTAAGQRVHTRFANAAIRVRRRFNYDQVSTILARHQGSGVREPAEAADVADPEVAADLLALLLRMRDLAMILRKRRRKRGALELSMPEPELEFDAQGQVTGAHFARHDVSHQIIEEFMLSANEAVAEKLADLQAPFLHRVHPPPDPEKLKAFAEFAAILGYKVERHSDRFALQRILEQSAGKPDVYAVHYALLRSLKQAVYSPAEEGHYALASDTYCHFTSPIRRYPDLTVHRLLDHWLKRGKAHSDPAELVALGEHCSKTERRAEAAERQLVKIKLLAFMNERIGIELEVVITGVADYGFYAQAENLPIEGLVHVSTLTEDYFYYDETAHTLAGRRTKRRYRLGDKVIVTVVRVDLQRMQLDFRVKRGESGGPRGHRGKAAEDGK